MCNAMETELNRNVKMKQIIFSLSLVAIMMSCTGQTISNNLSLTDFTFSSIFGTIKTDSTNAYCLLGTGFFRTPRSDNSDSLIADWINKHPKAIIIPVSSFGPSMNDDNKSKITYCWLVDGNDTINNYLIRNGCFPGGTMQRPQTWSEMTRKEKSNYRGDDKPNISVLIDKSSYDNFIEQIKTAEIFASENKLGIWNNPDKYRR